MERCRDLNLSSESCPLGFRLCGLEVDRFSLSEKVEFCMDKKGELGGKNL